MLSQLQRQSVAGSRSTVAHRHAPSLAPRVPTTTAPVRGVSLIMQAGTINVNDFKTGVTIEIDNQPYRVLEFLHVKPGKGAAFVRTKLKNLLSNSNQEKTFRGGETVGMADVQRREAQFSYMDGEEFVFMDQDTYEETRLARDDWAKFLKEGAICSLLFYSGKVISVEPPNFVDLLVVDTPPGVKGNTASGGGSKKATLETGAVIDVPLFINNGELIKVDARSESYLNRAKE
ncbi:hypothetical protein OEZ85_011878 [Tetradesmus obliquus]|uniref:Elongation factor P n=1 Tax=Tetradesmus obliquus TaxID=3088 RepID=A0ABY8TRQ1_TETOB|nr:hypothetical protein OEZ85_011878 [Tetradesmus obliquus]